MIHFMLREASEEIFNWDDEYSDEEDSDTPILTELKYAHPDTLFKPGSHTWVYDHHNNVLYHAEYPEFHSLLLNSVWKDTGDSVAGLMGFHWDDVEREDVIKAGFMIGRTGNFKHGGKNYPVIGFWNEDFDPDAFDNCLRANLREFSELANRRDEIIIISDESRGFEPMFLSETPVGKESPKQPQQTQQQPERPVQQEDPEICKKSVIRVDGIPMDLSTMLGKIHNPAGSADLEKMHNAFCGEYPRLNQELQRNNCSSGLNILRTIDTRFKQKKLSCNDDWEDLKEKGRRSRNAGLRDMFKNPETIDQSRELPWFHTQKDIDAAWDELQGKREHTFPSFLEWMKGARR